MDGAAFVYYWITFAVLVPVFSAVVFLLARKAGYFKNQDRLRFLALWAEVPEETAEKSKNRYVTTGPDKSGHTPCTRVATRKRWAQADEHRCGK